MANLSQPPSKSTPNLLHVLDAFANEKKTIVNTYFQTETGGIITAPKFNDTLTLAIPLFIKC